MPFDKCDPVDLEPFNQDPIATTINFCTKYGLH